MTLFKHGGDINSFANALGCPTSEVIDLSSNINFIKPNISIDFNNLTLEPYPNYDELNSAISQRYDLSIKQFELFNGASSAIFTLFNHLRPKRCFIFSPAYVEFKKAAQIQQCECHLIPHEQLNDQSLLSKITSNTLVVIVNPSTPDGLFRPIDHLISLCQKQNAHLIIDESFLDFCPEKSAIHFINDYKNVYILKSMTKFYAAAGIRIGLVCAHENSIKNLAAKEPMWKISQFDMQYLIAALKDLTFEARSVEANLKEKSALHQVLSQSQLIETIYPSNANFFLVKLKNIDAEQLQEKLKPYKILIRNCANFDFLDAQHVRIAVKSIDHINLLSQALS